MLVRILEYDYDADDGGRSLENGKFVKATQIDSYDRFLSMLQNMKGKDIVIGDDWYTYEGDYYLSFPRNDECVMSLDVFVCAY